MGNNFKIWKTIKIGTKTKEQLMSSLRNTSGVEVSVNKVWDLFTQRSFQMISEEIELDLVLIKIKRDNYRYYWEICEKMLSKGLKLCPPETAAYLALTIRSYPDEIYQMAMEPIVNSGGCSEGFYLTGSYPNILLLTKSLYDKSGVGDNYIFWLPKGRIKSKQ